MDRTTAIGAAIIFFTIVLGGFLPTLELVDRLIPPPQRISPVPAGVPGFGPAPPTQMGRHRAPEPTRRRPSPWPWRTPWTPPRNTPPPSVMPSPDETPTVVIPTVPSPTVLPSTSAPEVTPTPSAT